MKKIALLLVLNVCFLPAFSQEAVELLAEDFENASRNWNETKKDDHIRVIQNGKLVMVSGSRTYYYAGQSVFPGKKKNFKIETEISFTKFKTGDAGIMWGGGDKDEKMYFFLLSPLGAWNYGVRSPNFYSLTGSQKSAVVNKGLATNTLRVEKVGNKLKLFVNDVEVHSTRFPSTKGTLLGLVSGGGSHTVEADYFRVSEMEPE